MRKLVAASTVRKLLAATALLAAAGPARQAIAESPVVAVMGADLDAYKEALRGFEAGVGAKVPVVGAGAPIPQNARVVAAFGIRAASRSYGDRMIVISCLAPGAADLARGQTRVSMVPPPEKLLAGIRAAQPLAKSVAVLWLSPGFADYADALKRAGERYGLKVRREELDEADELPERLRALRGSADALWLAPDPQLINARSFSVLTQFARAARLPLYVPTSELVKEGATGAIAVSFFEAGRTAGLAAKRALSGEALPPRLYAEKVEAVFDAAEAARDGLKLSTDVVNLGGRKP